MLSALLLAASIALTDDLNRPVRLERPAQRIVTLAPFLTELVFAAGAGDRVVGVSAYSDFPAQAKSLPQVSSAAGFSIERIAALKPDLALVWRDSVRPEEIERIESFGARVYVASARELEDVPRTLEAIGLMAGVDASGMARDFRSRVSGLRARYAGRRNVGVLLELSHRPLMTIAGRHYMNEALAVCGARNVFEDLPGVAPMVSWEDVYARDPEAIVAAGTSGGALEFEARWRERPTLAAVRSGRLVYVDADTFLRPTPRIVQGIAQLCEGLDRARR